MSRWAPFLCLAGCGASVYVPREPALGGTGATADTAPPPSTADTGGVTSPTADTGPELPPWGCSVDGGAFVTLEIRNLSSRTLTMWWVDQACVEQPQTTLYSGQSTGWGTYGGHVFLMRDPAGDPFADYTVGPEATQLWEITE